VKRKSDEALDICEEQKASRQNVAAVQHRQVVSVKKKWVSYTKEDLDSGDVCTIKVKRNTRAVTDFWRLPVMVTKVITSSTNNKSYHVCSKHGHLTKSLYRNELTYLETSQRRCLA